MLCCIQNDQFVSSSISQILYFVKDTVAAGCVIRLLLFYFLFSIFFSALISVSVLTTKCSTIILCLAFRNLNLFQNTNNEVTRLACKAIELGI